MKRSIFQIINCRDIYAIAGILTVAYKDFVESIYHRAEITVFQMYIITSFGSIFSFLVTVYLSLFYEAFIKTHIRGMTESRKTIVLVGGIGIISILLLLFGSIFSHFSNKISPCYVIVGAIYSLIIINLPILKSTMKRKVK